MDLVFATMAMLPERAKAVQYSKSDVANEITLVTNNAPSGTEIRRFDDDAATIQALLSGQVQAVGANSFYPQRLKCRQAGIGVRAEACTSLPFTMAPVRAWAKKSGIKEVLDTMVGLANDGMTMICVTQEMGFARQIADRVIFIAEGQILEVVAPEAFFRNPQHPRTRQFLGEILTHH